MRASIEGLRSPHPLGANLPALYQEDDFAQSFVSVFDDALAPIFNVLDNIAAYFDPGVAPEDYLDWLSGWVGVSWDDTWPTSRRRHLLSRAVSLHRWKGTTRGLSELISIYTGVEPEIEESGGSSWSSNPGEPMSGRPDASLLVRLRVPEPTQIDERKLDSLVLAAKPAHVPHHIEILPS